MIPKSEVRDILIDRKLHIYGGPLHDLERLGLPQFIPQPLPDPTEILHLEDWKNDPEATIIYHSAEKIPEELSHLKVDLDPDILVPFGRRKPDEYKSVQPSKKAFKKF